VSGRDRIVPEPPDCGLDAAPYLLGALEPHEARAFMRHLEGCAVCRDEVASLAPVLDALPASAPSRPVRPAFRRRMLGAVRAESKVSGSRPPGVPLKRSAPAGWLALGLATAAAALLVAFGIPHERARARVIQASVGQADLRVDAGGHGDLIVHRLPALPANRVYELWLVPRGRRPMPSTLFAVTSRGGADVGVPGDLHGIGRVLVTVEPPGGTLAPTGRAVIVERLT
jgi:anti-sigma-K factor RskA